MPSPLNPKLDPCGDSAGQNCSEICSCRLGAVEGRMLDDTVASYTALREDLPFGAPHLAPPFRDRPRVPNGQFLSPNATLTRCRQAKTACTRVLVMGQLRQMEPNSKADTSHRFPLDGLLHKLAVLRHSSIVRSSAERDDGSGAAARPDTVSERSKAHGLATTSDRFPEQSTAYELKEPIGRGSTSKVGICKGRHVSGRTRLA